jgi:hypothetical protein
MSSVQTESTATAAPAAEAADVAAVLPAALPAAEAAAEATAAAEVTEPQGGAAPEMDYEMIAGLFPKDCTPEIAKTFVTSSLSSKTLHDDMKMTFTHATELQDVAVRFRMFSGASRAEARAAVVASKGIDIFRLWGLEGEPQEAVKVILAEGERKRKEPEA